MTVVLHHARYTPGPIGHPPMITDHLGGDDVQALYRTGLAVVIQRKATASYASLPPAVRMIGHDAVVVERRSVVQSINKVVSLQPGSRFSGPTWSEIATVETGHLSLDVTTAGGSEFRLRQFVPGDVVIPIHRIESAAFSLIYRSDDTTRIAFKADFGLTPDDSARHHQAMLDATFDLLSTSIRMIQELAYLPASHRLYCELVRLAFAGEDRSAPAPFALPTHAALAARLCTTRETVSRELSFLRRNDVIVVAKQAEIVKLDFLLNGIASALNLHDAGDVWDAIGVDR